MLEITNKVINKNGQAVKNKVTCKPYICNTNRCIDYVQYAVSAIDRDNYFVQIGFIRKEGGQNKYRFFRNIYINMAMYYPKR